MSEGRIHSEAIELRLDEPIEVQHADDFADDSLDDLAERINEGHQGLQVATRRLAVHVAQVGSWLTAAKDKCQHGEWLPWLADNCPESSRSTTGRYMRLYDKAASNTSLMTYLTPTQAYRALGVVKPSREVPELPPPPELKAEAKVCHTDADSFLQSWPDQSVDLLLTDPPYMTDVEGDFSEFVKGWTGAALPKLKPSGQAYICTGSYPQELGDYIQVLMAQGYMELVDVLVWSYKNTMGPKPKNSYKRNWQAIFYLRGPEAPALDCPLMVEQFSAKEINAPDGRQGDRFHAWQKPDQLAEQFVRHGSAEGDTVIDPFAGTGTFLLQAARWGRNAYGAEIDPNVLQIAIDRGCHEKVEG